MLCLLVETDRATRDLLDLHLKNSRHEVLTTQTSGNALALAIERHPQLVLCSHLSAESDGYHFLRALRSKSALDATLCLFYSDLFGDPAGLQLALAQGADAAVRRDPDNDRFLRDIHTTMTTLLAKPLQSAPRILQDELAFLRDYNALLRKRFGTGNPAHQQAENRFRNMVENSPDWFWEFDENANFTYVSPRIKDLLGFEVEDILGQNAFDLMSPEEAERVHRKFDPIARRFEPFSHLENVNLHKDGHKVIIESNGIPIFDDGGTFQGYRGIDRDITARKETEHELRLTQFCLDRAGLSIFRVAPDGLILDGNAQACRSLGYSREELLSKYVSDLDANHSPQTWSEHWEKLRNTGRLSFQSLHQRKDGSVFPVFVTVNHLQFMDEEFAIGFVTDITEQKLTEDALLESERRLKEAQRVARLGHYSYDPQSDRWESSEVLDEIFGVDADFPRNLLSWQQLVHPDYRQEMGIYYKQHVLAEGKPFDHEYRILRPSDGQVRWVHGLGQQEMTEDGQPGKLIGTIQDITERKSAEKELRLVQACVEDASVAIFRINEDGAILAANRQACQSLGYTRDELCTLFVWDVDPTFSRTSWFKHRQKMGIDGRKIIETIHRRKDGRLFPVQVAINYINFENERFSFSFAIDISERQRAEEELQKSEERLRLALMAGQQGIFDLNTVTGEAEVSPEYATMLGYDPATFRETNSLWLDRLHPDDYERVAKTYRAYVHGEVPEYMVEFRLRTRSGDWKWILSRGRIVARTHDGTPLRMLGTHTDISQRKEVEAALVKALREAREARENIDALLKSIADALIVTDPQGNITLLNRAAEKLLNISLYEAKSQPIGHFIQEKAFLDYIQVLLSETPTSEFVDVSLPDPAGAASRMIQARAAVVYSTPEQDRDVIVILRDVTREREVDRLKNEFISVAAHELRTPLAAIMGYTELLKKQDELGAFSPEEQNEFLETILAKGERLEHIIDDLLDISRIESGRPILLDKKPCEVLRGLKKVITTHQREATRHTFVFDFPEQEIHANLDRGKMEQVMDNLLNNAIKYSPHGGTIRVTARASASNLVVSVADEGIGMTPEQMGRIFEKFYRADTLDTAVSGLGLGMSIAKSIVEAHDGRIWVESAPHHGTTVTFSVPLDV